MLSLESEDHVARSLIGKKSWFSWELIAINTPSYAWWTLKRCVFLCFKYLREALAYFLLTNRSLPAKP